MNLKTRISRVIDNNPLIQLEYFHFFSQSDRARPLPLAKCWTARLKTRNFRVIDTNPLIQLAYFDFY